MHALVIGPLTTRLVLDGAPFLLQIETPPTVGRSLRFFRAPGITLKQMLNYPFFWFSAWVHHLSFRIAIVFSLLPITEIRC